MSMLSTVASSAATECANLGKGYYTIRRVCHLFYAAVLFKSEIKFTCGLHFFFLFFSLLCAYLNLVDSSSPSPVGSGRAREMKHFWKIILQHFTRAYIFCLFFFCFLFLF